MINNLDNAKDFMDIFLCHMEKAYRQGVQAGQASVETVKNVSATPDAPGESYDMKCDTRPEQSGKNYLGIYDSVAYGVYDNMQKLKISMPYWKKSSYTDESFDNYEDALEFAQDGVSQLSGVPVEHFPPIEGAINYRNRIFKGGK